MKDRLLSVLGSVVIFVLQLLIMGMTYVPFKLLALPWWADSLILLFMCSSRALGGIVHLAIWVWSFIILLNTPFSEHTALYCIFFVLTISFYIFTIVRKNRGQK